MPKRRKEQDVFAVVSVFEELEPLLTDVPTNAVAIARLMSKLEALDTVIGRYSVAAHMRNLRSAVVRGASDKARRHLSRVRKVVRPVSNDHPYEPGADVGVVRTRHGWFDGRLTGKVVARFQGPGGVWSYQVRGEDGGTHDVAHTRDLLPAY